MNRSHDDRWILRSRELLEASAAALDPARQRALAQARQRALASLSAPHRGWSYGVGAALAAALGVLLVVGQDWLPSSVAPGPAVLPSPTLQTADAPNAQLLSLPEGELELLAAGDEQALLEDYEFYVWLGEDESS